MGEKSSSNYSTGGWCRLREHCAYDGLECERCYDFRAFVQVKGGKKEKR